MHCNSAGHQRLHERRLPIPGHGLDFAGFITFPVLPLNKSPYHRALAGAPSAHTRSHLKGGDKRVAASRAIDKGSGGFGALLSGSAAHRAHIWRVRHDHAMREVIHHNGSMRKTVTGVWHRDIRHVGRDRLSEERAAGAGHDR